MFLRDMDPRVRFAAAVRGGIMDAPVKATDCRIFYVEDGQGWIHIDGTAFSLRKRCLFYCCGGSTYRVQSQTGLQLICINFDLTHNHGDRSMPFPVCSKEAQWPHMPVHYDPVEDSDFLSSYLYLEDGAWLRESIDTLVAEQAEDTELSRMLCSSLLKTLLLQLHRAKRQEMPAKLAAVQAYIRSHYMEPLTNRQLGDLAGYHEYYLNRTFLAFTGMNLHEYLVKVRMEQAAWLILNTELPLNTIAEQVGIRSYPHFSSCFRKSRGCSPAQFRKQYRAGI